MINDFILKIFGYSRCENCLQAFKNKEANNVIFEGKVVKRIHTHCPKKNQENNSCCS